MATDLRECLLDAAGDPEHGIDLASIEQRGRRLSLRRRVNRAMSVVLVGGILCGGVLLLATRSSDQSATHIAAPTPSTTAAEVFDSQGDRVQLPAGWYRAATPLVPQLLWPKEILAAATFPISADDQASECDSGLPKGTLDAMQPTDAFVWLVDWFPSPQLPAGVADKHDPATFPSRPTHFSLDQFDSLNCTASSSDPGTPFRHLYFSEHGRVFGAYIVLGDQVTAGRTAQVLSLLDSLRFTHAGETSLRTPSVGHARADLLRDGSPVWVVRHADADVSVVSAISTHAPFGLRQVTGWCPSAQGFQDGMYGSTWDDRGEKVGGPAPANLPSTMARPQRLGRVTASELPPESRSTGGPSTPVAGSEWCFEGRATGFDGGTSETWAPRTQRATPAEVARQASAGRSGVRLVRHGALVVSSDDSVSLCRKDATQGTECTSNMVVSKIDTTELRFKYPGDQQIVSGDLLVRLRARTVEVVAFVHGYTVQSIAR